MSVDVTTAAPGRADGVLLRVGRLSDAQAQAVADRQAQTGRGFDETAIELGLAEPRDLELAEREAASAAPAGAQAAVSDEIVVISDPASARAEAIRLARTQVISQHVGAGRRAFAVCAAVDGSGATFIAANMAVALAQVGIKTLLVDANLRSPRVDAMFGIDPNGLGLSSYLTLQASRPERVIHPDVLPNLSVLPSGPPVARPQELLSTARFRACVDTLLREFDVAVFDTPAANENADALTVAGLVGYALIVARRDHAYTKDAQALAKQLAAARCEVIGAVLNDFA